MKARSRFFYGLLAAALAVLCAACRSPQNAESGSGAGSKITGSGSASAESIHTGSPAASSDTALSSAGSRSSAAGSSRSAPSAGGSSAANQISSEEEVEQVNTFFPLGRDIMPIGAWIAPPPPGVLYQGSPDFITRENYQKVKDAGINIIYGLYERSEMNQAQVMKALDMAAAVGVKYLVRDAGVYAAVDDEPDFLERVGAYRNHPAYLGNMVVDEPAIPEFDNLGLIEAAFQKHLPDRYSYMNLMPNIAKKNQMYHVKTDESGARATKEEYLHYVNTYLDTVNPRLLSYDDYPLEGAFPHIASGYFDNMSTIRRLAASRKIPSWMFVQSCSFNSNTRVPRESETAWLVNTALAYGYQGIQYFTFWLPDIQSFTGGMVDRQGNKTPVYADVQKMNRQIAAIDHVLMNATFKGLMVGGTSPVPVPKEDILTGYQRLQKLDGTAPVLAGCFSYNKKAAYYIVGNSLTQAGTATLTFDAAVSLEIIQDARSKSVSGKSVSLNLAAGEGALVVLK